MKSDVTEQKLEQYVVKYSWGNKWNALWEAAIENQLWKSSFWAHKESEK